MRSRGFKTVFSHRFIFIFSHSWRSEGGHIRSKWQITKLLKLEKHIRRVHNVFDQYSTRTQVWRFTYGLCIPSLLWQPKGDNVKEKTECERCPVQLAVRWKKMLHHKGSFAISLERGSWCRMEIDWFTDRTVVLRIKMSQITHNIYLWSNMRERSWWVHIVRQAFITLNYSHY